MTPRVRSIIVGMGGVSQAMLEVLQQKAWHEVVAVVDVRDEALQQAQTALTLPQSALFRDLDSALHAADANTVIINSPSQYHYAQAKVALTAGLTTLIAKPFTNDYEQAAELVSLARDRDIRLCIAQQTRYFRHYLAVKQFIASGQLGHVEQLFFLNAKPRHEVLNLRGMSQPVLFEMSCHHFDLIMSLFPDPEPEAIVCDGYQPSWSVYDGPCMINALIRFNHGLHVLYHAGYSAQAPCYEVRLEGPQGALRCRGIHMSRNEMTYAFAPRGGEFASIEIDRDIPITDPWDIFIDRWYEYLSGGEEPPFSGRNNLKVFALLSAAIDSLQTEAYVKVAGSLRYQDAFEARV